MSYYKTELSYGNMKLNNLYCKNTRFIKQPWNNLNVTITKLAHYPSLQHKYIQNIHLFVNYSMTLHIRSTL